MPVFPTVVCSIEQIQKLVGVLPNQELSGAKSEFPGETVGVCSFIGGAANYPIIYP